MWLSVTLSKHRVNKLFLGWDGMDWIDLVQDRDQWRALVNTAMSLWVP
jgi:hypothetical protein